MCVCVRMCTYTAAWLIKLIVIYFDCIRAKFKQDFLGRYKTRNKTEQNGTKNNFAHNQSQIGSVD